MQEYFSEPYTERFLLISALDHDVVLTGPGVITEAMEMGCSGHAAWIDEPQWVFAARAGYAVEAGIDSINDTTYDYQITFNLVPSQGTLYATLTMTGWHPNP